jgi:hypothetical protein
MFESKVKNTFFFRFEQVISEIGYNVIRVVLDSGMDTVVAFERREFPFMSFRDFDQFLVTRSGSVKLDGDELLI